MKKKILIEINTTEKEIEGPINDARDRYKNSSGKKENEGSNKKYSYQINRRVFSQKEEDNIENNNEDKDGSDSKRYHRRYRASYKPNEQKNESNVTYNRYRRKV